MKRPSTNLQENAASTRKGIVMKTGIHRTFQTGILLGVFALGQPQLALAHTSYMLPNLFTANTEEQVTVQSAFTEKFFQPEIAVDAADFHIILPDGSRAEFETIAKHRQVVLMESPLKQEGTYRFTTGVRLGRVGKIALIDGKWQPVRGDTVPANATEVRTSQTETVADAYVTKKAPTTAAVEKMIGRLVIKPVTHPNDVVLGGVFDAQILFDGKPLADHPLVLDRAGAEYDDEKSREVKTDTKGMISLSFSRAGIYELMARHRAAAPEGATTDERSYTTSLTFEVQPD